MALQRLGYELGQYVELEPVKEHRNAVQTTAEIVMALAAVFAVIANGGLLAWSLVGVIAVVFASTYGNRALSFFRVRAFQKARNKMARAQHGELQTFTRQFSKFTNSGDCSNLKMIVFTACGNNPEKCAQIMPPDYMHDLCQFLVQDFETPSKDAREFFLAAQKFYGYIASYNKESVIEPFRKMRLKQWHPASASDLVPELVTWIESIPAMYKENTERQIEDFRERWAVFLDDVKKWVEKMNDTFGTKMPSYLERPQKL